MGVFKTSKMLYGNPVLIPNISSAIVEEFRKDGYEVTSQDLVSGGKDISITKGGMFKAIIGMKTALKISLKPCDNKIQFEAGVGIFGLQAIPAAIALFVAWPVMITQIWGLVQQSKLDDKALEIAERVIYNNTQSNYKPEQYKFCANDGSRVPADAEFCPYCGRKV